MMRIAIVTDSTSDIPPELTIEKQIVVIPAILVINGISYEDGKGLSRQEFYEQMPKMVTPPTTATPAAGDFQQVYDTLFSAGYEKIISIHVSSTLSGIFNTAKLASKAFNTRVNVIDSRQLSLGLGYQVLSAADAITQGIPFEGVLQAIEKVRQRIRVVAMLDTLEYIRRSGRVSWARARIGGLLRIKPFVEVRDGKVFNLGQVRSRRKGIEHLNSLCNKIGTMEKLAILHTNAVEDAMDMAARLYHLSPEPPMVVNVTTIIGTHVGPNGLGFAAVFK